MKKNPELSPAEKIASLLNLDIRPRGDAFRGHWTMDTETAGLFGPIRLIGWSADGQNATLSEDPMDFWEAVKNEPVVVYVHNLEFDLGKIMSWSKAHQDRRIIDQIDWAHSLCIHHRWVRIAFKDYPVVWQDSAKIWIGKLEDVTHDFLPDSQAKINLEAYIKEGQYASRDDFFKRVPTTDHVYRDYLRRDCTSLWQVVSKSYTLADLGEKFYHAPTVASLAMRYFQTHFESDYHRLTWGKHDPGMEEFIRAGFIGGRTEVFTPIVWQGYHYDVNSLYPWVMENRALPIGPGRWCTAAEIAHLYRTRWAEAMMIEARVRVPDTCDRPVLPTKFRGRLLFPTGEFEGVWTMAELKLAEQNGTEILEFIRGIHWAHSAPVFRAFIRQMKPYKINGHGAEKAFFKNIMNNTFGKTAQRRELITYLPISAAQATAFSEEIKDYPLTQNTLSSAQEYFLLAPTIGRGQYIKPEKAAFITAYARIKLYEQLAEAHYCDTDSTACSTPLPPTEVHPAEFGRWKLEREFQEARFVAPKLYMEIGKDGEALMKSKGLIRDYRESELSPDVYRQAQAALAEGTDYLFYASRPGLRSVMNQLQTGADANDPILLSKSINARTFTKRQMDYANNTTHPWNINQLGDILEQPQLEREYRREEKNYHATIKRAIWRTIMPSGINDPDFAEDIPRSLKRKKGRGLDAWAMELTEATGIQCESANEVLELIQQYY